MPQGQSFLDFGLHQLTKMDRSLVNGVVKGRISIMLIANFVILRSDVIMPEKHKWYSTVQRKTHGGYETHFRSETE